MYQFYPTIAELQLENMLKKQINFGRIAETFIVSQVTPGHKRLPRKLKKATKIYMQKHKLGSMIITPQNQAVFLLKNNKLYVATAKY